VIGIEILLPGHEEPEQVMDVMVSPSRVMALQASAGLVGALGVFIL